VRGAVAAALLTLCLGLTACETGHEVSVTNRCAKPIWVRYGRLQSEVPTEVLPGKAQRFAFINDDRTLSISATTGQVGTVASFAGGQLAVSGSLCPN
jgi:hypothetical protein